MQTHSNLKRINKHNINFFINGDFTNDGTPTFAKELPNHPAFKWDAENNPIFDALAQVTMPDGSLKYPDKPGTPEGFDIEDLATEADMEDGVFSADEKQAAMAKVYNAITDKDAPGYDFDVTKGLIGEYMTLRQEKKFYGGKSTAELKGILPTAYGTTEAYIKAGGNIGYAQEVMGYTWNTDIKNRKGKSTTPKTEGWDIDKNKEFQKNFQNNSTKKYNK